MAPTQLEAHQNQEPAGYSSPASTIPAEQYFTPGSFQPIRAREQHLPAVVLNAAARGHMAEQHDAWHGPASAMAHSRISHAPIYTPLAIHTSPLDVRMRLDLSPADGPGPASQTSSGMRPAPKHGSPWHGNNAGLTSDSTSGYWPWDPAHPGSPCTSGTALARY